MAHVRLTAMDLLTADNNEPKPISKSSAARLTQFRTLFETSARMYDISQNPSQRSRIGSTVCPTLTKSSMIWHEDASRIFCSSAAMLSSFVSSPMLPVLKNCITFAHMLTPCQGGAELLLAHGIPGSAWAATAMNMPKWICPVNDNGLARLAGNSMAAPNVPGSQLGSGQWTFRRADIPAVLFLLTLHGHYLRLAQQLLLRCFAPNSIRTEQARLPSRWCFCLISAQMPGVRNQTLKF